MSGFLRGAILGLGCGVIAVTIVAMVFPSVDPAKYSDVPDDSSVAAPNIIAPDVTTDPTDPSIATSVETSDQTPEVPKSPDVTKPEETPAIDAAPLEKTNPDSLPNTTQTPDQQNAPDLKTDQDAAIEIPQAETVVPAQVAEGATGVVTKEADPVDVIVPEMKLASPSSENVAPQGMSEPKTPTMPSASLEPEVSETTELPKIDAESLPEERVQSEAEAQNEPPRVLDVSPEAPRALVKRPVEAGSFGKPVGNFVQEDNRQSTLAANVRTDRLPSISTGEIEVENAVPATPNALRDNGAVFTASGKPLIGVMLIEGQDRSQDNARLELIKTLGQPVTIGLDPLTEGAADRAKAYAAAGAEIVIFSDLPVDATPQDIEVAFAAYRDTLPMAVAVMEKPASDASTEPRRFGRITQQHVITILADTGLGLIAKQQGLNSAIQLANKHSVPNVQVFYNISTEETQDRLQTIFNRAVFRASQKGASVLTIPGDVSSLTSLQAWALVDRPTSIQMAPVSAVLLSVAPQ